MIQIKYRSSNFDWILSMENYIKVENEEEFKPEVPIEGTKEGVLVMHVKAGSKIKNLMQVSDCKLWNEREEMLWKSACDEIYVQERPY